MTQTDAQTRIALSVADRVAIGKAARARVPRSSHAAYEPAASRRDPVAELEIQAQTRIPELASVRYGRMLVSPFTFYRGAAAIMAGDLAWLPRTGLTVQCCGDAHLSNFGMFASPERRLVFDINDFDETHRGPWEWDVKRLAASMLIAARDNGYSTGRQDKIVRATVSAYRSAMRQFARMSMLDLWYALMDGEAVRNLVARRRKMRPSADQLRRANQTVAKARTRDSISAFHKLTEVVDGRARIVDQSPLIVPVGTLASGFDPAIVFAELHSVCTGSTLTPCPPIVGYFWTSTSSAISHERSWASAAWGPAPSSRCSWLVTTGTPC